MSVASVTIPLLGLAPLLSGVLAKLLLVRRARRRRARERRLIIAKAQQLLGNGSPGLKGLMVQLGVPASGLSPLSPGVVVQCTKRDREMAREAWRN